MTASTLDAMVHTLRHEAEGILGVELRPAVAGIAFPPFEAGAHIDLHLPNGMVRSYSLCNGPGERHRYVVAVLDERNGRGGSRCVHRQLRVGDRLAISPPRNLFALHADAPRSVLVAGGIGITPIFCMLQHLVAQGRPVELVYCARSAREAAFREAIAALGPHTRVALHFDDEQGGPPDLTRLLAGRDSDSHYYGCGPAPMLEAFLQACERHQYPHAHIERFTALQPAATATGDGFEVLCRRSNRSVRVAAGQSVLDALLEAGLDPAHSCKGGVCGACETPVLDFDGALEHNDGILSREEQQSGKTILICVSRCTGTRLVLDL